MLRSMVAASAFFCFAAGASAGDVGRAEKNPDTTCTKSAECVIVQNGGCSGGWMSVNKKHEAQYIKRANDMNSAIECAHVPVFKPKPRAACARNTCITVEKK